VIGEANTFREILPANETKGRQFVKRQAGEMLKKRLDRIVNYLIASLI
jgi:hypothetical protein